MSNQIPIVSIIIPCKNIDGYVQECIENCLALDYPSFEILLIPDSPSSLEFRGLEIIPTGPVKPAVKRNIGTKHAAGDLCAFIDSDAYPRRDWLKNALRYFQDPDVAGVGGASITPESDSLMQKACIQIFVEAASGDR